MLKPNACSKPRQASGGTEKSSANAVRCSWRRRCARRLPGSPSTARTSCRGRRWCRTCRERPRCPVIALRVRPQAGREGTAPAAGV